MNDRTAMQMALEALEEAQDAFETASNGGGIDFYRFAKGLQEAITALREALAQPQDHIRDTTKKVQGEWVDLTAQEKANIIYAAYHRNPMSMLDEALLLLKEKNTPQVCTHGCDDNACPECYLEHQEPIAKVCHDLAGHIGWNPDLDELPEEGTLLYTTPPSVEAAIEATKEKAAKVCDSSADGALQAAEFAGRNALIAAEEATECATAIRKLK